MRKIALVNQKGGCGKTTTVINLASCLAEKGKKVLLIDLDPQGHSAVGLGIKPEEVEVSTYEVLTGKVSLPQAVQKVKENFDGVFANVVLSGFEQMMAGVPEREYKLSRSLGEVEGDYDYLIIDTPPSVGLLTFNALMAAEEVIIPIDSSFFSMHGLGKLLETIQLITEKTGHGLGIRILAADVDRRTNFGKEVVEELWNHFPENCFTTVINTSTRLREAASYGKPINEYDRRSTGCRDYQDLTREILKEETGIPEEVPAGAASSSGEVAPETGSKEVLFRLEFPGAGSVQIAGDFNNWVPENVALVSSEGRQLWQKVLSLAPGSYQYKFLIDGNWVPDPANSDTVADAFGGVNSVIHVAL